MVIIAVRHFCLRSRMYRGLSNSAEGMIVSQFCVSLAYPTNRQHAVILRIV